MTFEISHHSLFSSLETPNVVYCQDTATDHNSVSRMQSGLAELGSSKTDTHLKGSVAHSVSFYNVLGNVSQSKTSCKRH